MARCRRKRTRGEESGGCDLSLYRLLVWREGYAKGCVGEYIKRNRFFRHNGHTMGLFDDFIVRLRDVVL